MRSCPDIWQKNKKTVKREKVKCSEKYTEQEIKNPWLFYPQESHGFVILSSSFPQLFRIL